MEALFEFIDKGKTHAIQLCTDCTRALRILYDRLPLRLVAPAPSARQLQLTSPAVTCSPTHCSSTVEPESRSLPSDVTLDLNGQTIAGPANLTGVGIRVIGAQNVVVRNGNVQGVFMGVVIMNSANVKIDSLLIRGFGIAVSAPPPEVGIMLIQTKNAVINNNQIFSTGLGIFVRGSQNFGNRIEGNTLTAGANATLLWVSATTLLLTMPTAPKAI